MFVSILQRLGFKASAHAEHPLQSRAGQITRPGVPFGDDGGVHPEAASQRRQTVKAKPEKSVKASKNAGKPTSTSQKAVKTGVSMSVVKTTTKAVAKPEKASKPAPKVVANSVVKKAAMPAVKAKPLVNKPTSKPAAKALPVKVKVQVQKPVKAASQASAKPAINSVLMASDGVVGKPVVNAALKAVHNPAHVAVSKKAGSMAALPVASKPAAQPKPVSASNGLPPPPPLKPGRRSSSRALAHMPPPAPMVPTHAPDAAKASYSTMTERVIAPPPHVAAKKDPKLANNWKTKAAEDLTDEEVKAMPDAEYMNDKQMAFFRYKLSILKQDIHNSAGATTEHLREDTAVVPDPADRATIEEEHALELRTRDRERKLLKKIEQSISRIDSGDYGYCDETGEPIGVGRLIARPTASLSLEAQQRRELKQKMFGD